MEQHKAVEDYINSVIPKKISDNTKDELRSEIECHIYDKAEFYMEIGYNEEEALCKAIEEMGEPEPVREELSVIYKDSTLKGILLCFGICSTNLLTIIAGWGFTIYPHNYFQIVPNFASMTFIVAAATFIIFYTVKCFRQKLYKQLTGITIAFTLIAITSFAASGLFYAIFNGIVLNFQYIFSLIPCIHEEISKYFLIAYSINIVFLFTYSYKCFYKCFLEPLSFSNSRRKKHLLSLKSVGILLSCLSLVMLVNYAFAYEKYERWYPFESKEEWYAETPKQGYLHNITSEQRNTYLAIKGGDDITVIEETLTEKGFIKQNISYKDFVDYDLCLQEKTIDFLKDKIPYKHKDCKYKIYCYTNDIKDKNDDFDDIVSCIIFSYDDSNKIIYKLFIPRLENGYYYKNYHHGAEALNWRDNLNIGINCKSALEYISNINYYMIEDVKYEENKTLNTYHLEFNCSYPLETNLIDFLFGYSPDNIYCSFDLGIKAENGVITHIKKY